MFNGVRCETCGYLCTLPLGSGSAAFHDRFGLNRNQDMLNKSTKPGTDLCHVHGGPSMARKEPALSWTDVNSHRTMMALPCCATWYAHRWGGTCTSTTVAVNRTIIQKYYISPREWSRTPTKRKTRSRTAFTGAAWVSLFHDMSSLSFSGTSQVSKVTETTIASEEHI